MKKNSIEEVEILKEKLGSKITLYDEDDQEHPFLLLSELKFNNNHYAYFHSLDEEEGDIIPFRVIEEDGEYDLEFIEDDKEFEQAVEAYDKWSFDM